MAETRDAAAEIVETARGAVEFARRGEPPYVVLLHGTPGGPASILGEPFEAAGFGTITPSRPGYLRTPLATGRTFAEQADAVAALLDALAIPGAELHRVEKGWHLLALGDGAEDCARAEIAFLRKHLAPQPPAGTAPSRG